MSRVDLSSHLARPLSFAHSDEHAYTRGRAPSPSPGPTLDTNNESSRSSNTITSVRWSRITPQSVTPDVPSSDSISKTEDKDGSNSPMLTVQYKGTRALTGLSDISKSVTGERPKVAIRAGLRHNWTKIAPHILSISVTVAVVQLSFRDQYWMDLTPPSQLVALNLTQGGALNALQLAAKLHEILIMASVSSIVLHAVQHYLNGAKGLPLGMLTNAFELGSGQFLRRRSFWSALWRKDPVTGKRSRYLLFWLLSLFSTILVTLAGPSSAIAIIPTLGYFDLHHPFNETILPYFVFNETMELWPTALTNASLNAIGTPCNDPTNLPSLDVCPAGGFRDTYNWAQQVWFGDSDGGTNISFPDQVVTTSRVMSVQSCNSTYSGRASAMGLNGFMTIALAEYWVFLKRNKQGIALQAAQPRISVASETVTYAPRIEVICNSYSNADFDANNPGNQTTMMFPVFGGGTPIQVPDQYYKYARPMTAQNFSFVELPKTDHLTPSLGAVSINPLVSLLDDGSYHQSTENVACSIYSQWIPVNIWYEPMTTNEVSYSVASDLKDTCLTMANDPTSNLQPINVTISSAYANAINEPIGFTKGNVPALLAMFQLYVFNDSAIIPNGIDFRAPVPGVATTNLTISIGHQSALTGQRQRGKLIATVLAGVVGDGLARVAGNGQLPYSGSAFLLPNLTSKGLLQGRFPLTTATGGSDKPLNATPGAEKNWLPLNPTISRYGYGYHWYGSRTAQFGISILLIHVAVAIIHIIVVISNLTGKYKGLPCAPSDIPEMISLAVNSASSERLRNTCAGIGKGRTWEEPVGVRETNEGHLELVVGAREMASRELPRVGVAYGALPEVKGVVE